MDNDKDWFFSHPVRVDYTTVVSNSNWLYNKSTFSLNNPEIQLWYQIKITIIWPNQGLLAKQIAFLATCWCADGPSWVFSFVCI